jgi:hypothetical protein
MARLRVLLIVGVAAVSAGALALWHGRDSRDTPAAPVQLVVSGDTAGWIVPCGCTSSQSGGLPRRGTFVRSLTAAGPVIVADAGGAVDGNSEYHRIKFEAILRGELAMGLAAHNIGGAEAAFGTDELRRLATELGVPFVSANVLAGDGGAPLVTEPLRIVSVAGRRFALTGVLSVRYAQPKVFIADPRQGVLDALAAARGRYDSLVVLAYMPEEELRAFAAALPEADVVGGGPTGQSIAPTRVGPTMLASATNKGKFLVHLTADTSARWSGTVVELDQSFADDAEQQANVRRYLDELGRRDIGARDTGLVRLAPAGVPDDYRLAGTTACKECHRADAIAWAGSKHAHAWETLVSRGYHVDPFCQQCHTTGFALPGGFASAASTPYGRNVGCESCHGPAQAHVRDPKVRTPFAARDQCVRCHDRENSPTFAYEPFWEKIRHGTRGGGRP